MYRQGLGDCFLITLPTATEKPFYMMIDCGVVLGSATAAVDKLKAAVADIIATTGGHLDLLVATHEHWDHVSGFVQAKDLFTGKLTVGQSWVAWTEDPADKLATKLRAERRTAEDALRLAVQHLAAAGNDKMAQHVDSLVSFFGATGGSTSDAMTTAKGLGTSKPRYCEPGEPPIVLKEVPGVRFYVLGPPKDEKLIKKSNPGKGEGYGLDAGPGGSQAFLVSALRGDLDGLDAPFDAQYAIPLSRAEGLPFFAERYFGPATDEGIYEWKRGKAVKDQSWRRIDSTWLESSETMALQLDSATNNTSLVLAIEIVATGEVLLFPGDAQAGNWLSWQDVKFENGVTGPALLARTVFYKVGHHGSHNATLKEKGLEMMTSDELVAMIPVDHEMAVKTRWGLMPLPELVDRLKERTHGRVLRVDDKATTPAELGKEWKGFAGEVKATELYFELSF
jgi:hypothetical protein